MSPKITLFPLAKYPGFYGYLIDCRDTGVRVRQEFAPGVPGIVRMTDAQAQAYAEAKVQALVEAAAAAAVEAGQGEGGEPVPTEP